MIRWGGSLAVTHLTRLCLLLEVMLFGVGLIPFHTHTNYAYVWSGVVSMIWEGGMLILGRVSARHLSVVGAISVISYTPMYTRVVVIL